MLPSSKRALPPSTANIQTPTELPYDPGFDMPDYKELGAKIWRMGTVIDFRTIDGTRPREKPVALYPQDLMTLDTILPSLPVIDYGQCHRTWPHTRLETNVLTMATCLHSRRPLDVYKLKRS